MPQVRARTSPGVFRDMALLGLCLELSFSVLYCRTQANLPTLITLSPIATRNLTGLFFKKYIVQANLEGMKPRGGKLLDSSGKSLQKSCVLSRIRVLVILIV